MTRMQIKDLKVVLKDFEPMVKDPKFLRNGRPIKNFSLLPREAWANWLLCVVLRSYFERDVTFAEDEKADGVIYDRDTDQWFLTEHVSALKVPSPDAHLKGEDRVISAIQKKIDRGAEYARGKRLMVFIEDAGEWYPNRVGRQIHNTHYFDAVYCVGLLTNDEEAYEYSVTQFDPVHSPTWRVRIEGDFSDWEVTRVQ